MKASLCFAGLVGVSKASCGEADPRHAERIVKEWRITCDSPNVETLSSKGRFAGEREDLHKDGGNRWYQSLMDIARCIAQ